MVETVTVRPAPELRAAFAQWAVAQVPKVVTNSHDSFAVPAHLLTFVPEEALIGALVDGHRYRSPLEDERDGTPPPGAPEPGAASVSEPVVPGSWPGPEPVTEWAPLEDDPADGPADVEPAEDAPESWPCEGCDRTFATRRGLNRHRAAAHPEGA